MTRKQTLKGKLWNCSEIRNMMYAYNPSFDSFWLNFELKCGFILSSYFIEFLQRTILAKTA